MNFDIPPLYLGKRYHAQLFALLGVIGFVVNLMILFVAGSLMTKLEHKILSSFSVSTWVLLPPLWFFYEYFYYFPKYGNPSAGFERLKSVQDVSSKVWAAVAVVLAGIYSAKFS